MNFASQGFMCFTFRFVGVCLGSSGFPGRARINPDRAAGYERYLSANLAVQAASMIPGPCDDIPGKLSRQIAASDQTQTFQEKCGKFEILCAASRFHKLYEKH